MYASNNATNLIIEDSAYFTVALLNYTYMQSVCILPFSTDSLLPMVYSL